MKSHSLDIRSHPEVLRLIKTKSPKSSLPALLNLRRILKSSMDWLTTSLNLFLDLPNGPQYCPVLQEKMSRLNGERNINKHLKTSSVLSYRPQFVRRLTMTTS